MLGRVKITYTGGLTELDRKSRKLVADALISPVEYWYETYLPLHFKGAVSDARYKKDNLFLPRSRKYEKLKQTVKGHNKKLVFSGLTETMATKSGVMIRTSYKQGKGTIQVPKHIIIQTRAYYKGNNRAHDLIGEILTSNNQEAGKLAKIMDEDLTNSVKELKEKKVVIP